MPDPTTSPPSSTPKGHRARLAFQLEAARSRFREQLTTEAAEELRLAAGALAADILVAETCR